MFCFVVASLFFFSRSHTQSPQVLTDKVRENRRAPSDPLPMKARLRRALNSLEEEELKRSCDENDDDMDTMHNDEEENIRENHKAAGVKNVARLLMKTGRGKRKNESKKRVTPFVVRCDIKENGVEREDVEHDIVLENLTPDTTEDEIRQVFSQFGKVSTVFPATKMKIRRNKGGKKKKALEDVVRVVRFDSKSAQEAALNQEIQILGILIRDQMCYTVPPENRTVLGIQNISKSHDIETVASELGAILNTTVYSGNERLMDGSWRDDVEELELENMNASHALPSLVLPENSDLYRNEGTCLIEFRNCVDALHAFSMLTNGEILGKRMNLDWKDLSDVAVV